MSESQLENRADQVARLLVRVYEIHEIIIVETGGLSGLREGVLLHSAVARPFATFGSQDLYASDFEKAAALFHSLIKSHPFIDGTKRTAFAAALFFLESCGYSLPTRFPFDEVIDFSYPLLKRICVNRGAKPSSLEVLARLPLGFKN